MMTYQIRKRIYRIDDPNGLKFPNEVEISFEMRPLQAFGMEPGNGRTAVQSVAAHATFDANTGWHTIESRQPLKPLDVTIEESDVRKVEIRGNMLKVTAPANSLEDLNDLLQSIFIGYPILLSIEFGDPVVITRVDGKVGGTPFRWELTDWRMEFDITTQKHQERKAADSWFRFNVISEPTRRRLMAALHYFHVAIRLARVGISPWEFMSEAILNFSKVLEALFPPHGDGRSIDAARSGLKQLGYTEEELERDFIPAIALRNGIDVGHVHLSVFTHTQLRVLHDYTENAENRFRELLRRALNKVQDGSYTIIPYTDFKATPELIRVIDRIEKHLRDEGKATDDQ